MLSKIPLVVVLETGTMVVLVPPQQTQHNSLQGDSTLKRGRTKSDSWAFFCPRLPRFYSKVFQGVADTHSRFRMVQTGRCCPGVCEGTKPTGNTRPELGCENRNWASSPLITAQPSHESRFFKSHPSLS